jgi:hypothetical protein
LDKSCDLASQTRHPICTSIIKIAAGNAFWDKDVDPWSDSVRYRVVIDQADLDLVSWKIFRRTPRLVWLLVR